MKTAFFKIFIPSLLVVLAFTASVAQAPADDSAAKLLPDRIGDYKAAGAATTLTPEEMQVTSGVSSAATRAYRSRDGRKVWLRIAKAPSNSTAYALMTNARRLSEKSGSIIPADIGTAGFQHADRLVFVKGPALVAVHPDGADLETVKGLGKEFAARLDAGEGDIPVLIKHLPNWESVQDQALFFTDKQALQSTMSQPVLDALNLDGGAEAAVADYNGPKMVLIEFNTPQIATDNDQRINAKLAELRNQGQGQPAYRRVGNYAVFVFDAPSTEAANQLIDQVKYQQMVQWLGENPYRYDRAVREFADTTLGVFVNVVKASGLVILGSLAVGGLLGAILFSRRRAQQRAVEAYSDAGGMLRLNLDQVSRPDPRRLLGP